MSSDIDTIIAVLVRYATGIDRRDWDLFRSCFDDECVAEYGTIGRWTGAEAITRYMIDAHAAAGPTLHRLSNFDISIDGDRVTTRTYVDALVATADGTAGHQAVGIYDDELLRTADNAWSISRRRFTLVRLAQLNPW